jgi:hypothetical protein
VGNPRSSVNFMAWSIGILTTPVFLSTQPYDVST